MNEVRFTCTTLPPGKRGILTPDADGFYSQPIGALNCFNSNKQYYPFEAARAIFENSSTFMRRVQTGCLTGELGHPVPRVGEKMSDPSFMRRVMTIDKSNECVFFREIWLDMNSTKDAMGRPIVTVMGKFKPFGDKAKVLEDSVTTPGHNTCFSLRAFTNDHRVGGVVHRDILEAFTYDHVPEPGIDVARKFRSPALESFDEVRELSESVLTRDTLREIVQPAYGTAMEQGNAFANALFHKLGWDVSHLTAPKYLDWK
jgi:hypothetical protein